MCITVNKSRFGSCFPLFFFLLIRFRWDAGFPRFYRLHTFSPILPGPACHLVVNRRLGKHQQEKVFARPGWSSPSIFFAFVPSRKSCALLFSHQQIRGLSGTTTVTNLKSAPSVTKLIILQPITRVVRKGIPTGFGLRHQHHREMISHSINNTPMHCQHQHQTGRVHEIEFRNLQFCNKTLTLIFAGVGTAMATEQQ